MKKNTILVTCIILCVQNIYSQKDIDSITHSTQLREVTITAQGSLMQITEALEIISTDSEYLSVNRGNSLMNSLDKIPGIKSMQIGQGFSKPMIRGLGFNRVAVLQNGVKQQGQQWGADHGLEIDQYDVERVEIYKGASSLQYGSDAIAGAIVLKPSSLKIKDGLTGLTLINGASNNRLFGGSINAHYQQNNKFLEGRVTHQNFESYRIPAKQFHYLGWVYPIHNKILKNTAGKETNLTLRTGIIKDSFASNLLISNVYSKTGFFAGAHGIPTEVSLKDNGKYRHIGLPYQRINHFKVIYNQTIKLNPSHEITFDLGYQNNNRKEFSEPHTHGIAKLPDTNLELELKLQTGTFNTVWINQLSSKNRLTTGLNTEYQENRIDGYSFLLPQFKQIIAGLYAINRLRINEKLVLTAGVRYDYGRLKIHEFTDPYLPEEYKRRANNLTKNMGDVSFSGGASYNINPMWLLKINLGKSFRMATANELSSNGVHHGTFRHELGDNNLKSEKSYQLDQSIEFTKELNGYIDRIKVNTGIFVNYFPNFIFLNPTGEFSWLPDAGQYYRYEQSETFRAGGEIELTIDFAKIFRMKSSVDYVYAKDLNSKYPIPFTPPLSITNELSVNIENIIFLKQNKIALSHCYTASQNRVSRNELSTSASNVFGAFASIGIPIKKQNTRLIFQALNIFDKKYYNHLSFYRHLDIPEIGRNFRLTIQIPIGSN